MPHPTAPDAASPRRPNIILITTDQQRWDAMGLNCPDTPLQTPTLDALAARGVNFTRAYSTCPVCIPARRSLLTGLHPQTHGLRGYQDGLEWDPPFTLPGLLSQAGYQTQLIGKLHLHPQRKRYGFDHMIRTESPNDRWDTPLQPVNDWADAMREQGIRHPNNLGIGGNGRTARPWDLEERFHHTSWLTDRAVDFVTRYRDPSGPFFLHLSYWAPHPPLIPPQAYWNRYYRQHDWQPRIGDWAPRCDTYPRGLASDCAIGPFAPSEMADAVAGYFGLVNHLDDRISYFLSRLFEYGSPRAHEPTYIIFTSDHGEMLGDHHLWRKSLAYEGSAHVPFFISGRNVEIKRGTSEALVGLEDVCATVLELAGEPAPEALSPETESKSLTGILRGEAATVRDRLFGECRGFNHHYLLDGHLKYIWYARTNEEQLFDLAADPYERADLSAQTDRLTPLRRQLQEHLATRDDYQYDPAACRPCAGRSPEVFWPPNADAARR